MKEEWKEAERDGHREMFTVAEMMLTGKDLDNVSVDETQQFI
jgi:hypothetical protein